MLINLIGMANQTENDNTNNIMFKNDIITLHWAVKHDSSKIVNFKYSLEYQNQRVKVKNDKPIEFQPTQMVYVHLNKKIINETIKDDGIKIKYENTDLKKIKTDCFLRVPSCILLYKNNEIRIDSLVDNQDKYHLYNVRFDEKYEISSDDALNLIGSLDETLLFLKDKARNFYSECKNEIGAIFSSLECYVTEDIEYETEQEEIETAEKDKKHSGLAGIFMHLYSLLSFNKLFGNSSEEPVPETEREKETKNGEENKNNQTTTNENHENKKQNPSTNPNVETDMDSQEASPLNSADKEVAAVETNSESNKRRNILIIGLCSGGGVIIFILLVLVYRKYKKGNNTSNILDTPNIFPISE